MATILNTIHSSNPCLQLRRVSPGLEKLVYLSSPVLCIRRARFSAQADQRCLTKPRARALALAQHPLCLAMMLSSSMQLILAFSVISVCLVAS